MVVAGRHNHDLAGRASRVGLESLRLEGISLEGISLGDINLGGIGLKTLHLEFPDLGEPHFGHFGFRRFNGFALPGRQIGRFNASHFRRRSRDRIGLHFRQMGTHRFGAEGTGFGAEWLGLLLAHVQVSSKG
jgi:hypothetical protein